MTEIADKDIREALDRIARTRDGEILYLYLQMTRMAVPGSSDPGVLQTAHGGRIFARDLMGMMGEGISGGRDGNSERPIVFNGRNPADVNRRVTAREFLAAHPDQWPDRAGSEPDAGAGHDPARIRS